MARGACAKQPLVQLWNSRRPASRRLASPRLASLRLASLRACYSVRLVSLRLTGRVMPRLLVLCLLRRRRVAPPGRRLAHSEPGRNQQPASAVVSWGPALGSARTGCSGESAWPRLEAPRRQGRRGGPGPWLTWGLPLGEGVGGRWVTGEGFGERARVGPEGREVGS